MVPVDHAPHLPTKNSTVQKELFGLRHLDLVDATQRGTFPRREPTRQKEEARLAVHWAACAADEGRGRGLQPAGHAPQPGG